MYRKQVNEQSPIRILEQSIHGGLGRGNLGVVMARAGVGKTACLVQIALDELMRDRPVLHLALDQTVDHVQSWYDAIFDDLVAMRDLDDAEQVRQQIMSYRLIMSFGDHDLFPQRLDKTVETFKQVQELSPAAILVDGYPWTSHSDTENAAMLGALKSYAKMFDAELWMTAQTHRETTGDHPTEVPAPCAAYKSLIDVVLFLDPHEDDVSVQLLKDHDAEAVSDTPLHLHPDTLRLTSKSEERRSVRVPNSAFTLLSGGAKGAEAAFGECAAEHGLMELNFTFAGRNPARKRALVELNDEELLRATVSTKYVETHLRRKFPNTAVFRNTLASIWHQVNTSGEVFVIGRIQADDTVKGGTGWAAELARHWHKTLHVYDLERSGWYSWNGDAWTAEEPPVIRSRRFTGGGTRDLPEEGVEVIKDLFARSFR